MGQWLSERLGQPFVIDNRPGGSENIATEAVVRSSPDGYTILFVPGAKAIKASLYEKLSFNFNPDIPSGAGIAREPLVMVVNPSVPAKTVPEFIAYAKANPGKISMASAGNGSPAHVSGELFKNDWRQHGSRAVSRRWCCAARSARRTGAGHVPHHVRIDRIRQDRKTPRAGGDHRDAFGGAAADPDRE